MISHILAFFSGSLLGSLGMAFIAGAAKLRDDPPPCDVAHPDADEQRQLHRASVEAGYASLQSYVERYGKDAK